MCPGRGWKGKGGVQGDTEEVPRGGFAEQGIKAARRRLKETGAPDRKPGGGPKRARRTPGVADDTRRYFADNRAAACSDAARSLKLPRPTARMAIKEDLQLNPLRQATAQRVKPANMTKSLEACQK